ncbi:GAF domain-containing protein [Prauserella sp. Am3]|nr:GAF domain-containing protein [Prauserella sp. Am3]
MDTNGGVTGTRRHVAGLLELLANEASADAFDGLDREFVGDSQAATVALMRAGRIRELLADRKRREQEMQALLDTASDLASLRQVDAALDAIVARTRQMLGTDAAYLALIDTDADEVYMRVTLGTITPAIETLRQPPGRGVGGMVVQTGRPFATANYQRDTRIAREPAVADAVAEDGIVSMVGAPLRVGDEVIGALFGAHRDERVFEVAEIDLLCAFADHAAVVLENARLFDEADGATGQLRAANDQLAQRNRVLERSATLHERLLSMVLQRADLGELVAAVAEIVGGTVAAVDADGQVLHAVSPDEAAVPDLASFSGELDVTTDRPGGARRMLLPCGDAWAVPVRAGAEHFGELMLVAAEDVPDTDLRILERAAQTAALLQLTERQRSTTEQQVRGQVVDELLAEREPDWTALERRADQLRAIDFSRQQTVLVASADGIPRRRLLGAVTDVVDSRGGVATECGGQVVALLTSADPQYAVHTVRETLERAVGAPVTAGVAGPAVSAHAVRTAHREARRCHQLLLALGRSGTGASMADLGVLGLVVDSTSRDDAVRLIRDAAGPLLDYDAEHGTVLVETVEHFFASGCNPRSAARSLQVHPNTVYQRLDRVDRLLGDRAWREPPDSVAVQLALQLRCVLDFLPAHGQEEQ